MLVNFNYERESPYFCFLYIFNAVNHVANCACSLAHSLQSCLARSLACYMASSSVIIRAPPSFRRVNCPIKAYFAIITLANRELFNRCACIVFRLAYIRQNFFFACTDMICNFNAVYPHCLHPFQPPFECRFSHNTADCLCQKTNYYLRGG